MQKDDIIAVRPPQLVNFKMRIDKKTTIAFQLFYDETLA
jgi:hypothetical protein